MARQTQCEGPACYAGTLQQHLPQKAGVLTQAACCGICRLRLGRKVLGCSMARVCSSRAENRSSFWWLNLISNAFVGTSCLLGRLALAVAMHAAVRGAARSGWLQQQAVIV